MKTDFDKVTELLGWREGDVYTAVCKRLGLSEDEEQEEANYLKVQSMEPRDIFAALLGWHGIMGYEWLFDVAVALNAAEVQEASK